DFWMPPLKELHYFDRLPNADQNSPARTLPLARKTKDRLEIARQSAADDRDRHFLDAAERFYANPSFDLGGYARLFSEKASLISGDITPGYSLLSDRLIQQIASYFPNLKVIFIARDPVERVWSQLSMYVRRGLIDPFDVGDLDTVTNHLRRPEVAARSHPSEIAARWRSHVRPELFQIYFFDDLKLNPARLRTAIVTFLGGDPGKPSGDLSAEHNAKAKKRKLPLPDSMRLHLAQFFERELKRCVDELGGPAAEWPARYGF
ncbi:MAG: hypothetical protein QOI34_1816, partial [Verrucomicrobiota bacterium]